jgi:hypothetical protein
MPDQDKSSFFTENGADPETLRSVASTVNQKHEGGEPKRRGRPPIHGRYAKGPKPDTAKATDSVVDDTPSYIDPEVIRTVFKSLVKTADAYIGIKFYNIVLRATEGDAGLAEQFRSEAATPPDLVDAYGEAAVGLAKKYAFLLEYAPEALMVSCLVADVSIKVTTFKKIQELCYFVSKTNAKRDANSS